MTTSHEKPILFSAPMVRAIIEGRKTMTRRVLNPQPSKPFNSIFNYDNGWFTGDGLTGDKVEKLKVSFEVGNLLWVREAWRTEMSMDAQPPKYICPGGYGIYYEADKKDHATWGKLRPSIFMSQWMSRITLEVIGVKIERLQDISEKDAKAEGLSALTKDGTLIKYGIPDRDGLPGNEDSGWPWHEWSVDPRQAFSRLWKSINGEDSWDANPWVAVYSFKRVRVEALNK
jgi:hypothetical protein